MVPNMQEGEARHFNFVKFARVLACGLGMELGTVAGGVPALHVCIILLLSVVIAMR